MEDDFTALTSDAITEILARSVSAEDLAKFGAASKGTVAATQVQDFWKRATAARWPEYAAALDACDTKPVPVDEGHSEDRDGLPTGESEAAAAAFVKIGSSSWKFFYYFRDVYESVADAFAANKKEDDYMDPPSRIPTAANAEEMTSALYMASMSRKLPAGAKLVVDLLTSMMRLVKHRSARWNLGKALSCCMSIPEAKEAMEDSFKKNFEVWVPFTIQCMRVREGPSKAPSFYLLQEVRAVVIRMLFSVQKDTTIGLAVAKAAFAQLHSQIVAFLASTKFEDDHLTASLVMASVVSQVIETPILQRLDGAHSFDNNAQALEKLQQFLVSEKFLKIKHGERANADPHNSHYPVAQVFSMSSALLATLHANQLNLSDPAHEAKLLSFVQQTLQGLHEGKENRDKVTLGMTALSVVAAALEQAKNESVFIKFGNAALAFGVDHDLDAVTSIFASSKFVSIAKFEAFENKILPKAVRAVLDASGGAAIAQASEVLLQSIASLPSAEYAALKPIKEHKDALIKKVADSLAEFPVPEGDPEAFQEHFEVVNSLQGALAAFAEPYGAEGAQLITESAALPTIIAQIKLLDSVDARPDPLVGTLALFGKKALEAHMDAWKPICESVLNSAITWTDMFASVVGLGVEPDHPDEEGGVGSCANVYWTSHKLCLAYPDIVKPHVDRLLAALDSKRAYSGGVCDNLVLLWVGLFGIDPTATLKMLKVNGNDLFFASSMAHMSSESEKTEALLALKQIASVDAELFELIVKYSSKPNDLEKEAQMTTERRQAREDWQKKAEEAMQNEDYDFGSTDDTKQPENIKALKNLTEEEHKKWVELVAQVLGKEVADKIR